MFIVRSVTSMEQQFHIGSPISPDNKLGLSEKGVQYPQIRAFIILFLIKKKKRKLGAYRHTQFSNLDTIFFPWAH
jgi:hypothetical protein